MNQGAKPVQTTLIIDTASPITWVGLGGPDGKWTWQSSAQESGIALFRLVAELTGRDSVSLRTVRTVAFCEGPGSMLGIRTAIMAIQTWMASGALGQADLAAYSSLALAAAGVRNKKQATSFSVAIDARRQSWYGLVNKPGGAQAAEIKRIAHDQADSLDEPVFLPDLFPIWNPRPDGWENVPYLPELLESSDLRRTLLRSVDPPEAFQMDPPAYQKWTPAINRTRDRPTPAQEANR